MFGIEHEITDGSLYILSDITDDLLEQELKKLETLSDNDVEKKSKISSQIKYYQMQIAQFKIQIEKQLQEKFQFSIEELYAMHGQYDKYLSFEFHKYSESAQKFGRRIHGIITYLKSERENLEIVVSQDVIPRTNDLVKIDCSTDETLSDIQKKELLESGVKVGDIYQILSPVLPKIKSFNNPEKKEIPNTITVNFDPADFDPNRSFFGLYSQKIKSGEKLIEDELEKFCGVVLFLYPESKNSTFIKENGVNADGSLKTSVRFYELEAKSYEGCLQDDERIVYEKLLASKRENRIKAIKYEISRSTNKKLEDFEKEYPEIYKELEKSISEFQTESLVYYGMEKPIYWDYESYLHIFLRHCEELAIEGRFEIKTKFQYYSEDIKRILKIAIKSLSTQINEKLKAGKFYRLSGDKSLYFNGNHYSIHILESGRVAAFHPLENPKNK